MELGWGGGDKKHQNQTCKCELIVPVAQSLEPPWHSGKIGRQLQYGKHQGIPGMVIAEVSLLALFADCFV